MIKRTAYIKRGKRPKKKSDKGKLRAYLDSLHVQVLKLMRGEVCEHCGGTFRLQGAHVLPKGAYPQMRYVHENLMLLCFPCHPEWWHKRPLESAQWFQGKWPGRYENLQMWARQIGKSDLKQIQVALETELKLLEAQRAGS